jgi:hypothetical protein
VLTKKNLVGRTGLAPVTPYVSCPFAEYASIHERSNPLALPALAFTLIRHFAALFKVVADTVADILVGVRVPIGGSSP